ncbi:MAG TPA: hypothetical protein VGR07_04225 [Thermoanaerobaculia bacterium]|nr:hypothetical protein [Thermoanaerobaculia bacterium]
MPRLAELGVARLSVGSAAMRAVYGRLRQVAQELQGPGTFEALAEGAISYAELQGLMRGRS